jgi:general stress protein 26
MAEAGTHDSEGEGRIWSTIEGMSLCMMTTVDGDALRARPMSAIVRREEGAIWFFTGREAHKDEELKRYPQTCLAFVDSNSRTFVSVSGRAQLVDDLAKKKELWNTGAAAYFPAGPEDPDVILLRVDPELGEIWDSTSSSIVAGAKMLAARVRGTRPDLGDDIKVDFSK